MHDIYNYKRTYNCEIIFPFIHPTYNHHHYHQQAHTHTHTHTHQNTKVVQSTNG